MTLPLRGSPYYHVSPGSASCYGDQTFALLRSMAAAGAATSDLLGYMKGLEELCGEGSAYGPMGCSLCPPAPRPPPAVPASPWPPELSRTLGRRVIEKSEYPISGPWRHGSLKGFFKNVAEGKATPATSGGDDKQIDGATKMPPIVAAFAAQGEAKVLAEAEAAIRVTQDTDEAVAMGLAFARILYSAVTGSAATPAAAVTQCIEALRDPDRAQPVTPSPMHLGDAVWTRSI